MFLGQVLLAFAAVWTNCSVPCAIEAIVLPLEKCLYGTICLLFLHQHLIGSKARRNKEMAATTQALLLCLEPKIGSWDTVMTWQGRVSWVAHTQRQPEEGVEWMGSPRWLGRFRLAWFFESCSSGNSYRACFLFGMPRNDKCQRARLSNQQRWFKELLSKAHPLWPALIITRFLLKQQNNLVSSQHF